MESALVLGKRLGKGVLSSTLAPQEQIVSSGLNRSLGLSRVPPPNT